MSNKSNGTAFEREFATLLAGHDFWVHLMQDNRNGQPFDVIAARDGVTYVFDCKDCKSERFELSRIEANQKLAMEHWWNCENSEPMFAIKFPFLGIRLLSYSVAMQLESDKVSAIVAENIVKCTMSFKKWLEVL